MYKKKHLTKFIFPAMLMALLLSGSTVIAHAEESNTTNTAPVAESVNFERPNDPYNDALWSYDNTGYLPTIMVHFR